MHVCLFERVLYFVFFILFNAAFLPFWVGRSRLNRLPGPVRLRQADADVITDEAWGHREDPEPWSCSAGAAGSGGSAHRII